MTQVSYLQRRGQIETYFDRTAAHAWARLTSDAPVSRIRQTVREGRDRMRALMLSIPLPLRCALALGLGTALLVMSWCCRRSSGWPGVLARAR